MPPKDATKTPPNKWDDALERNFLLEIIGRVNTAVPTSVLDDIARKWGEPHTKGSLTIKLFRLKKAMQKENGAGGETEAKSGGAKRKAAAGDDENDGGGVGSKKVKKTKKSKAKGKDAGFKAETTNNGF